MKVINSPLLSRLKTQAHFLSKAGRAAAHAVKLAEKNIACVFFTSFLIMYPRRGIVSQDRKASYRSCQGSAIRHLITLALFSQHLTVFSHLISLSYGFYICPFVSYFNADLFHLFILL